MAWVIRTVMMVLLEIKEEDLYIFQVLIEVKYFLDGIPNGYVVFITKYKFACA